MRAILILAAALMFGVAGGYGWFDLTRSAPHVHVPKVPRERAIVIPQSSADRQWQERADDGAGTASDTAADSAAAG